MGTKISNRFDFAESKSNVAKTQKLLTEHWYTLSKSEQATWYDNTTFNTKKELDKNGFYCFMSHFMKEFWTKHNNNNQAITSIQINKRDASKTGSYQDRAAYEFTIT